MMTATHAAVRSLTKKVEQVGQSLHGKFLSSPDLSDDPHMKGINCYWTASQN
jgi:catabolite regulation protein CreA